jgi:hypothetical protein
MALTNVHLKVNVIVMPRLIIDSRNEDTRIVEDENVGFM